MLKKTIDNGETWITQYETNQYYWFFDIYFSTSENGWIVGSGSNQNYLILHTEDGGETWLEDTIPELTNWHGSSVEASIIYSIQFANDTLGWLTCADEYNSGYILLTTDGGETWQQQFIYWQPIYDIQMLNQDTGWAVGGDFIYFTANGTFIPVGIDEKISENKFITITPNPTTGVFTINTNNKLSIINYQLTDITGKEIMSRGHVPLQIDISNQPKGIYFITIKFHTNNQIYSLTKKIIKL